jgi:hypothetical protein
MGLPRLGLFCFVWWIIELWNCISHLAQWDIFVTPKKFREEKKHRSIPCSPAMGPPLLPAAPLAPRRLHKIPFLPPVLPPPTSCHISRTPRNHAAYPSACRHPLRDFNAPTSLSLCLSLRRPPLWLVCRHPLPSPLVPLSFHPKPNSYPWLGLRHRCRRRTEGGVGSALALPSRRCCSCWRSGANGLWPHTVSAFLGFDDCNK